jgi:hypothetical protein
MKRWQIFLVVLLAVVVSLGSLIWLVVITPTKAEDFRLEVFKIVAQGLVIGIVGLWLKYLFDGMAIERDEQRKKLAEATADMQRLLEDVLLFLSRICTHAIDWVGGEERPTVSATYAFTLHMNGTKYEYEWLLLNWAQVEKGSAAAAAKRAFLRLKDELEKTGDTQTKENQDRIKERCAVWGKYYDGRLRCIAEGKAICHEEVPDDWLEFLERNGTTDIHAGLKN